MKGGQSQLPFIKQKNELGIRERRRIFEEAIYIVAQIQRVDSIAKGSTQAKSIQSSSNKQFNSCVSVLSTVLGYHEIAHECQDGTKTQMLVTNDENEEYTVDKKKFEDIVRQMPNSKEVKDAVWKSLVKRDKKYSDRYKALIA